MILLGRLLDCSDAKLRFAQDADDLVRAGDDMFRDFVAAADALVLQAGLVVEPAPAPIPAIHEQRPIKSQGQLDIKGAGVTAVIWATGYQLDFGWIELPVFDGRGVPLHHRGASEAPGLYFLGLQWLYKAKSSFLCGVGEDAAYVAARIAADVH
jgi:putative flavoprotein involved in K+ transport